MNTQYFPHFIRMIYPNVPMNNEDAIEIGDRFKNYLENKFADDMNKLQDIWDINPITIIKNMGSPLKTNGYHPAFVFHFTDFCKQQSTLHINN